MNMRDIYLEHELSEALQVITDGLPDHIKVKLLELKLEKQ